MQQPSMHSITHWVGGISWCCKLRQQSDSQSSSVVAAAALWCWVLTTVPSLSLYTPGAIKDSSSDANKPSEIMLFSGAMAGEDKTHCACVCAFDSIVVSVCCCSCTSSSSWLPTGGHWQLSRHCWMSEEENVLIWPESFSSGAAGDKRWSNQEEEEKMRAPG